MIQIYFSLFPLTVSATSAKPSSNTTSIFGATATRSGFLSWTTPARPIRRSTIRCWNRLALITICFYVGPKEKAHFLAFLNERLRDRKLEPLVKNLFRPSYGGNRNCTLMYTLGGMMLSSDDDMRPYALVEDSPESLGEDEVCHGRLYKAGQNGYTRKSFDIVACFLDVLGKRAIQVPGNYERGELLVDTSMDLETNASKGLARENCLMLQHGTVPDNADREDGPNLSLRD